MPVTTAGAGLATAAARSAALNLLDPHSLLASLGTLGTFLVPFAETGLLIGFFLPGDSLPFTAGLLTATPAHSAAHLSLPWALLAAAAGARVGYLIGRHAGPRWLDRPDRPRLQAAVGRPGRRSAATARARPSCWPVHPVRAHGAQPAGRRRQAPRPRRCGRSDLERAGPTTVSDVGDDAVDRNTRRRASDGGAVLPASAATGA